MIHRIVTGTAIAVLALGLAGCSSDKDSTSSTTTSKQAVCADKDALEQSVRDLSDINLSQGAEASIKSGVKKVEDNLDALRSSVKADLKPEIDALKSALQDLDDAVKGFSDQSITDSLQETGTAISKVGSSAADLGKALQDKCPS